MLSPWLLATSVASTAVLGATIYGTFVPQSQFWGRVITRAPSGRTSGVALTFDDGPTEGPTERVLEILGDLDVKAAFFVIGQNCRRFPALLRRIHAEGHLVGNHTYDHSHYSSWRMQAYWDRQLRQTNDVIADIIGVRPAMFRPPMGIKQFHTMRAARKLNQSVIGWTRKARDGVATTSEAILSRLREPTEAGDILLLHDGIEPTAKTLDRRPTIEALPMLICGLRERGLELRRLDEMLGMEGYAPPLPSTRGRGPG